MTRASLLTHLLASHSQTAEHLDKAFGLSKWDQTMHDLIALDLVVPYDTRDGVTVFRPVFWKGKSDKPLRAHQAFPHTKEAYQAT